MNKSIRGFTIVELLIVVVIIAILAAIAIIGYNGMQQRAYRSKVAVAVDGYVKLFEMYRTTEGSYPNASYACLSSEGSLPATTNFAANECDSEYGDSIDPALNQKLKTHASNLPEGVLPEVDYEGTGSFSRAPVYSGGGEGGVIYYYLNGDYDCPRGRKTSGRAGITTCTIDLGEYSSGGGSTGAV